MYYVFGMFIIFSQEVNKTTLSDVFVSTCEDHVLIRWLTDTVKYPFFLVVKIVKVTIIYEYSD